MEGVDRGLVFGHEEGATVAELAQRLGYRSEAAFARAFKRVIGIPPGAVNCHSNKQLRRSLITKW